MGRPKKKINYDEVEKLAVLMCTQDEIANFLGISTRTLQKDKEFLRVYKKGLDSGKMSIRRYQFALAKNNVSMAIFLGKVHLGQRENTIEPVEVKETPEIKVTVVDNSNLEKELYKGEK